MHDYVSAGVACVLGFSLTYASLARSRQCSSIFARMDLRDGTSYSTNRMFRSAKGVPCTGHVELNLDHAISQSATGMTLRISFTMLSALLSAAEGRSYSLRSGVRSTTALTKADGLRRSPRLKKFSHTLRCNHSLDTDLPGW